jgi:hypothetical protein
MFGLSNACKSLKGEEKKSQADMSDILELSFCFGDTILWTVSGDAERLSSHMCLPSYP